MLINQLPKRIYILTIIHLCTFCIKINLSKYILSIVSNYENYENIYNYLIGIFLLYYCINIIHTFLLNKIKEIINSTINILYHSSLNEYINKPTENLEENKNLENTLSEFYAFMEIIYESYVLTIPKALIYAIYYTYSIFSYSIISGLILISIDFCVIYFYKYRNKIKEEIYRNLYQSNLDIKNEQSIIIKNGNINNIKNLLNKRDIAKYKEIKYLSDELRYSDFINNFVELIIFVCGIKYLVLKNIKPFDLVYLSMKSVNFINHTINLTEQFNIKIKYKTQIDNICKLHKKI